MSAETQRAAPRAHAVEVPDDLEVSRLAKLQTGGTLMERIARFERNRKAAASPSADTAISKVRAARREKVKAQASAAVKGRRKPGAK